MLMKIENDNKLFFLIKDCFTLLSELSNYKKDTQDLVAHPPLSLLEQNNGVPTFHT